MISIISTMLPRIEIDFIEEWLKYHSKISNNIIIFYDPKEIKPNNLWENKPNANYHFENSNQNIIKNFIEICKDFHAIVKLGKATQCHSTNQGYNFLRGMIGSKNKWILHIDADEFCQINNYKIFEQKETIGIQQQLMDTRCKKGKNKKQVHKIKKGKLRSKNSYFGSYNSAAWKCCFNKESFFENFFEKEINKHLFGSLIHGTGLPHTIAKTKDVKIFHYAGCFNRPAKCEQNWKEAEDIETQEFEKHFQKITKSFLI